MVDSVSEGEDVDIDVELSSIANLLQQECMGALQLNGKFHFPSLTYKTAVNYGLLDCMKRMELASLINRSPVVKR